MDEPVSLHPWIDPGQCIGTGACVEACPEISILGLIHNRAALISPSRCIGHGLCQQACPVDAITLVFGTEMRGVDIPAVRGNFETNVPGIFIAGELGGMGLIRNAVTQGREAAEYIKRQPLRPGTRGRVGSGDCRRGAGGIGGLVAGTEGRIEIRNASIRTIWAARCSPIRGASWS